MTQNSTEKNLCQSVSSVAKKIIHEKMHIWDIIYAAIGFSTKSNHNGAFQDADGSFIA